MDLEGSLILSPISKIIITSSLCVFELPGLGFLVRFAVLDMCFILRMKQTREGLVAPITFVEFLTVKDEESE